jgi:hypothetical protein
MLSGKIVAHLHAAQAWICFMTPGDDVTGLFSVCCKQDEALFTDPRDKAFE